jgi:hypothetical protein
MKANTNGMGGQSLARVKEEIVHRMLLEAQCNDDLKESERKQIINAICRLDATICKILTS